MLAKIRMVTVVLGLSNLWLSVPSAANAQELTQFPWGQCTANSQPTLAPHQALPTRVSAAARPVEQLPAKIPYAYGWFGPNPTPQWSRHIGWSRTYTQWTRN